MDTQNTLGGTKHRCLGTAVQSRAASGTMLSGSREARGGHRLPEDWLPNKHAMPFSLFTFFCKSENPPQTSFSFGNRYFCRSFHESDAAETSRLTCAHTRAPHGPHGRSRSGRGRLRPRLPKQESVSYKRMTDPILRRCNPRKAMKVC